MRKFKSCIITKVLSFIMSKLKASTEQISVCRQLTEPNLKGHVQLYPVALGHLSVDEQRNHGDRPFPDAS